MKMFTFKEYTLDWVLVKGFIFERFDLPWLLWSLIGPNKKSEWWNIIHVSFRILTNSYYTLSFRQFLYCGVGTCRLTQCSTINILNFLFPLRWCIRVRHEQTVVPKSHKIVLEKWIEFFKIYRRNGWNKYNRKTRLALF